MEDWSTCALCLIKIHKGLEAEHYNVCCGMSVECIYCGQQVLPADAQKHSSGLACSNNIVDKLVT